MYIILQYLWCGIVFYLIFKSLKMFSPNSLFQFYYFSLWYSTSIQVAYYTLISLNIFQFLFLIVFYLIYLIYLSLSELLDLIFIYTPFVFIFSITINFNFFGSNTSSNYFFLFAEVSRYIFYLQLTRLSYRRVLIIFLFSVS